MKRLMRDYAPAVIAAFGLGAATSLGWWIGWVIGTVCLIVAIVLSERVGRLRAIEGAARDHEWVTVYYTGQKLRQCTLCHRVEAISPDTLRQ